MTQENSISLPPDAGATLVDLQTNDSSRRPFVFLSYRSQDPDLTLAHNFYERLQQSGCETFMAAESLRIGDEWPSHIEEALKRCDYFLLLLSSRSAASDMVIEEVKRVKGLREMRPDRRPRIMPVRVNVPFGESLNYELDGYLGRIQQLLWQMPSDTARVLESVLSVIRDGGVNAFGEDLDEDEDIAMPPGAGTNGRPLPVAEPEWPEGRVPHDSKFYIVRPFIEKDSFKHIMKPAALIRIRAPRQMGKTSLLARILYHAQRRGCGTGQISFQLVSASTFAKIDDFLQYFCRSVGKLMKLPNKLDQLWEPRNDPVDNCTTYFVDYLLNESRGNFVLGLDETDRLFQYPEIAEVFFGMVRGWMDAATNDALWSKLRVVLVHSTECYITLPVNQSPFNIGRGFRLPPFSEKELKRLVAKHGLNLDEQVRDLIDLLAGHPYLIRLALFYLARKEKTISDIMKEAHTEAGIFSDHLRRHYWNLSQHPELLAAVKSIVGSRVAVSVDPVAAFKLEGMGLVKRVGNGVAISCELHKRYFQDVFHITV